MANAPTSPDLVRSALGRAAIEAIWVPASLLPTNGVTWEQVGPDQAQVRFRTEVEPMVMTLDAAGRVVEVTIMRWSDANAERVFRLQPFGGQMKAEAQFDGFTIPSAVEVGNHFGTADYLPFIEARLISARYF